VAAALTAYENFSRALYFAELHPPRHIGYPLPKRGNFEVYSFDPARTQFRNYVFSLTKASLAYRGTPPESRASVTRAALGAAPYPSVYLSDCPTAPSSWHLAARSGPPPTTKSSPSAPPPFQLSVQVIFYKKHWGVYKFSSDTTRTCSP
jgi:hypothetical protein